jgi:DNA-directed RNA polymerase specialized sigma24 family protein
VALEGGGPEQQDFAAFYAVARDDCLRTVLVSVGDIDVAQDLVAEAFARVRASGRKVSRWPSVMTFRPSTASAPPARPWRWAAS